MAKLRKKYKTLGKISTQYKLEYTQVSTILGYHNHLLVRNEYTR